MAKKERNQGSVGRARAKRNMQADNRDERGMESSLRPMPRPVRGGMESSLRPMPRPVRGGMESSLVPTPRPYTMEERGAVERGNRAAEREAQNFADGGMVRGCGPAQMSGKGFRGEY